MPFYFGLTSVSAKVSRNPAVRLGDMDVVAQRRLELRETLEVIVRVARPVADDRAFRCDFEIVWPDRTCVSHAFGEDEMQALFLALQGIHVELLASPEGKRGELTWLGMSDLHLPLPSSATRDDFK
jgi:hypothetical protein